MPHPDDETISCGGLIQKRIEAGIDVKVVYVFGRVYDYGKVDGTVEEHIDFQRAIKTLGVTNYSCPDPPFKEGEPHAQSHYALLKYVEKELRDFDPTELIGPSPDDLNQDHKFLASIIDIAMRPINQHNVTRYLQFIGMDGTHQSPNYYIPLNKTHVDLKAYALGFYTREMRGGNSPRALKNLEHQASVWGSKCNQSYAEGYKLKFYREV